MDIRQRLQSGIAITVWPTVACCLIAVLAFTLDGHREPRPGDPPLWALLSFYLAAGLSSAVILGLLWPLSRHRVGAFFLAGIAALPVSFGIILMSVDWHWRQVDRIDIGVAIALGFVFGPLAAAYRRARTKPTHP